MSYRLCIFNFAFFSKSANNIWGQFEDMTEVKNDIFVKLALSVYHLKMCVIWLQKTDLTMSSERFSEKI